MSDFYKARLSALYTPEGQEEVALVRHGHLLAEPAGLEWSLQTASYEYIAHQWAGDLPTGNARLTLAAQPLVRANTRAALERKLRHLELQLNLNRTGTLLLEEAFSNGVPTLHTYWTAVIETANASPLPLDQAPPIPGAWGKLDLSIILTNPSEEDPSSRQSSEGAEEDNPNPDDETTTEQEESTEEEESTESHTTIKRGFMLKIPDMYAAPWSTDANRLKQALLDLGMEYITLNGTTHNNPLEDWTAWPRPDGTEMTDDHFIFAAFTWPGPSESELRATLDAALTCLGVTQIRLIIIP